MNDNPFRALFDPNQRDRYPILPPCIHVPFGNCSGHADCRAAFWVAYDKRLAWLARRGESVKAKSRRAAA